MESLKALAPDAGHAKPGVATRNIVVIDARDARGQRLGLPYAVHNGTFEDMVRKAAWLQRRVAFHYEGYDAEASRTLGTNATGNCYAISPHGFLIGEDRTGGAARLCLDATARRN